MKCIYCGKYHLTLHRTNPKGQPNPGWACLPCIEIKEPELAKNIKEEGTEVEDDLQEVLNKFIP
jgi:hypothetical protein